MCGMTFDLSREHEEFRHVVREFAEAEIAPHAAQWDRDHHFPADVVQKMGGLGLMGLTSPEEYGGAGGGGRVPTPRAAMAGGGGAGPAARPTPAGGGGLGHEPAPTA